MPESTRLSQDEGTEDRFLSALPQIEAVIRVTGRRGGLSEDEISDFGSEVKLSMVRTRYRVLARYEGRSSLATYLYTVIGRLLIDFRRSRLGKWRSSAGARRLGADAVLLERLIYRDGLTCAEAASMCTNNLGTRGAEGFTDLARKLPVRTRVKVLPIDDGVAGLADAAPLPDQAMSLAQSSVRLEAAIRRAVTKLSVRERTVVRLRFESGLGAREIGGVLGLSAKYVYRKADVLLRRLRENLLRDGIAWRDVVDIAGRSTWALRWPEEEEVEPTAEGQALDVTRSQAA